MSDLTQVRGTAKNQPIVPQSRVKKGFQTLALTSEDMSDRIINLRFIHKPLNAGELPKTFTIRSDYEPQYYKDTFQYVPCVQKPSIKVSYKQVANEVVVGLNIDVTNLFIKDMVGNETAYGVIQSVEIQMGYRSQMPDWASDPYWSKQPIQRFWALEDTGAPDTTGLVPPERIKADVLSVQRISTPPDSVTRFYCVVGSVMPGLRWFFDADTVNDQIKKEVNPAWGDNEPQNKLPYTFFQLVTKRFIRSSQRYDLHEVSTEKTDENGNKTTSVEQRLTVFTDNYTKATPITPVNGALSPEDAGKYGVIVYMSRLLWEMPMEELPFWGFTADEIKNIAPVDSAPYLGLYVKIADQLDGIAKQYPFLCYYLLGDGNYFAYHVKEKESVLFHDPFILKQQQKKIYKLPAVYDITWSGTRQIRAPFFSAISSMMTVAFQSKYTLNDITGTFYQPAADNNCYLVLLIDVSFSTDGSENDMELTCTDIKGPDKPRTNGDGSITPVALPAIAAPAERNKVWKDLDLTVVSSYKGAANTVGASWTDIISILLSSAQQHSVRWIKSFGSLPTVEKVLDDIQGPDLGDNSALFSDSRLSFANAPESAIYGVTLPALFAKDYNPISSGTADVIHLKFPYLPSYDQAEKLP